MLKLLQPLDNKIVCYGMSCVGKTTFARLLTQRHYLCFDEKFRWHEIETLGLSSHLNLKHIVEEIQGYEKCVLDGWHLSDPCGELASKDMMFYVLYDSYDRIIDRYRVPVLDCNEHRPMFQQWYRQPPKQSRFICCQGNTFIETTMADYNLAVNSSNNIGI